MLKSKNKLLHKALAFVLTFSLLATLVSFNFTASALTGTGTEQAPYEITNLDDLKEFATGVNSGKYTNTYVKLTTNIEISGNWTPIGNGTNKFTGVFDGSKGNGEKYTITFTNISDNTADYVGLFGVNEGTIKNVTVAGNISSSTTKAFVGGVAGLNRGTITNCTNSAEISATGANSYAGGIAGVMQYGTIETCTNSGNVSVRVSDTATGDITNHEASAGGIVAFNYNGTVKKSTNTGNIENNDSHGYTGGIVGNNDGVIDNCLNKGAVSNEVAAGYVGGIAGNLFTNSETGSTSKISNSLNTTENGNVVGSNGIETKTETKGTIENCYYLDNDASVTGNDITSVTDDQLNSGEVTYMLNGNSSANPVWGQDLSTETNLPVIGAGTNNTVYPANNGYTNTQPNDCTHSENIVNGACTVCGTVIAKVSGYNVTLNGSIGLNYYFDVLSDITAKTLIVSFDKGTSDNSIKRVTDPNLTSGLKEGYNRYVSTVKLNSDEMNMNIIATLSLQYNNGTITVKSDAYNINKYLNSLYTNPGSKNTSELKTLAQTMSTYGYYANEYFKNYASYETSVPMFNLSANGNSISGAKYNLTYDGSDTDNSITHAASSLQHLYEIGGVFYANTTMTDINNIHMRYSVLNISDNNSFNGLGQNIDVKVSKSGDRIYAITEKIPVSLLGSVKFEVTFGTKEGEVYTPFTKIKYYSPYTYIRNILKQYDAAGKQDDVVYKLTQALYHYSEAANAYFNASSQS